MGYGIYTMRETHVGYEFLSWYICHIQYTISGIQNGCHIPIPLNHGRGIWDHIPLVIVASDSLTM